MDQFAVISDVHGNLEALEAVLAEIERLGVKRIVSLGDVVGYGPDPCECLRLVRARCELLLMGNHEFTVLNNLRFNSNAYAQQALEYTQRVMAEEPELLEFLATLSPSHQQGDILFVHGSARDPLGEYVNESDQRGYSLFDEVFESLATDFGSVRLCFVGHNHKPFLATTEGFLHPHQGQNRFCVGDDEKMYVSVGAVGQPRDGDPRSCFTTFDGVNVRYHRVRYADDVTAAKIRERGLPSFLADRLSRGM